MKKLGLFPLLFLFIACNSGKDLRPAEAYQLIREQMHYPVQLSWNINQVDARQGDRARRSGLVEDGYLSVIEPGQVIPKDRHLIEITDKGKPFLMKDMPEEHTIKVRTAKANVKGPEDVSVHMLGENANLAVATYTVSYSDQTPFTALFGEGKFQEPTEEKAYFSRDTEGKWHYEENPGPEFSGREE